ncbi:proline/glycine betaine ABC transporter permease [Algiphilus sp.]|uniref:ABC transporter permease n=1 Tax=Algiphilus sp. TaxID=1872431 RepID=UPI001CA6C9CC|nr:proline/glycine betaine ABC transporter permease [Algiphilus sp.]MBY8964804.1 proline/glycine betaine ABC transporter permease [Algiphilus acroporae]MCI5063221.1 proline/glycine betaine ABC transporter permease [Algiphilus sp.]MCI5103947.1 proline/glycine betaine ABC transporter permease [Algiphilus sp.]MCR9090199.1 proline/glycine betaine ABC transporter permease [Pseudomonadota bacterium]
MARELPIGEYVSDGVDFLLDHAQGLFDGIAAGIEFVSGNLTDLLQATPIWAVFAVLAGLGLWRVGWRFALFVLVALYVILGMDLWEQTMDTLGLVLAATLVALGIGLPSGVAMAKSDIVAAVVRPVLDFMQTLPAFVYLIPAVLFFGLGEVPGTIATVIFSMPPAVRLMNLGIRHVPVENVEAGRAFGCNGAQLLFKVELPLAMPSIMAGVNQTIMLALSMVVIASMIGAGGLGNTVLTGIQRLDVGLGFEGGLGVVILAIILDRLTQSFGSRSTADSPLSRLKSLFSRGSEESSKG